MGSKRRLAMSRTGRWLLVSDGEVRELVDLTGTMPTRVVELGPEAITSFVGRELWAVHGGALLRLAPTALRPLSAPHPLPGSVHAIVVTGSASISEAVLVGDPTLRVGLRRDSVVLEVVGDLRSDERLLAGHGARLYLAS